MVELSVQTTFVPVWANELKSSTRGASSAFIEPPLVRACEGCVSKATANTIMAANDKEYRRGKYGFLKATVDDKSDLVARRKVNAGKLLGMTFLSFVDMSKN